MSVGRRERYRRSPRMPVASRSARSWQGERTGCRSAWQAPELWPDMSMSPYQRPTAAEADCDCWPHVDPGAPNSGPCRGQFGFARAIVAAAVLLATSMLAAQSAAAFERVGVVLLHGKTGSPAQFFEPRRNHDRDRLRRRSAGDVLVRAPHLRHAVDRVFRRRGRGDRAAEGRRIPAHRRRRPQPRRPRRARLCRDP